MAGREESIVADPDKPVWEYVLGEKIQEIDNIHGHDTMLSATSVILVVVGNSIISDVLYPGIADGNPKGISPDVLENLVDSLCRRF